MNAPTDLMHTLAWSLLHFLWQGAAIAALAAALMYVFRKPATRYLIGVGALGLMLMSFTVTFAMLSGGTTTSPELLPAAEGAGSLAPFHELRTVGIAPAASQPAAAPALDFAWVAQGWLIGVFVLALRIAFGLFVIEQLRRRNLVALPDALVARFHALQARLGIARGIRYAECGLVNVPAVIGFFRPVVLIPMRALTGLSPEQLEALIAHELGHIKRFDVAVNFVQVIAETLFFFHPAVWWLNRRIRADREDCCDDIAVSAGGSSVGYARALATIANWRDAPDLAMAATGGPVAARVARLLGVNRDGSRTAGVFTASLVLAGALVAGAVSLGLAEPAQAQTTETPVADPPLPPAPAAPIALPSPAAAPAPIPRVAREARPAPAARPAVAPRAAPAARPAPDAEEPEVEGRTSYIEEMRGANLGELDVDTLVALKSQGVTREYIADMRATGLEPSVDQIVAMKIHGVTPAYVQQVRQLGFDVDTDELIAFRVHGISPQYVNEVRAMGFDASADSIVAMKVHDITPAYVKQMRDMGFKLGIDEIIAFKVHDISPDYVRQMRADGFNVDAEHLVALKVHDVSPQFRKSLESAGLKLSVDQLVHAKVMDITPEFIDVAISHGFKNLDIDQLIALKNADVL